MFSKNYFKNETFIRVISVLVAVILWMYVIGVRNPRVTVNIRNIPVQIVNVTGVSQRNLKVIEMSDTALDVKVAGRRADVAQVSSDDIKLTVDASSITSSGEYTLDVSSETSVENVVVDEVSKQKIKLYVDQVITVEKVVKINVSGEPKTGYAVREATSNIDRVLIEGPRKLLETVDSANVTIDVTGADKEVVQICNVELYTVNGTLIEMSYITLDNKSISVKVPVDKFRSIKIVPNVKIDNPEKYMITAEPDTVDVYGAKDIVDAVNQIETSNITAYGHGEYRAKLKVPEKLYLKDDITSVIVKITEK